jgi:uncharacterized membrane protein
MHIVIRVVLGCLSVFLGGDVHAQVVHQELQETVRAEVLRILSEETRDIIGTDTNGVVQDVQVRIESGERAGEVATFENDLVLLAVGDSIYVNRLVSIDGIEYYQFKDADRTVSLALVVFAFVVILVGFTGIHGLRALASLALSIGAILFVLIPLLLSGYSPVFASIVVAGAVLAIALFLTHGVNARSTIAFIGTFGAIVVTSGIAIIFVNASHLTGLSSDAAIYLNFSTKGTLDFGALLLGSIIIGILGVLDDVAITQAAVVAELRRANASFGVRELYTRALRVGRAHITSLVNTLSFAYIGVALPLVLLLVQADSSIVLSLNQEMVAAELIRIFVGSIGLILAVPFTTIIGALWYARQTVDDRGDEAHYGHIH